MPLSDAQQDPLRSAVADLLGRVFAEGELVAWDLSREAVPGPTGAAEEHVVLHLRTSAGDTFACSVRQPEVPGSDDPRVAVRHLAEQLETWLPTSALGWGGERRLPRA